ncbi:MAG TPA: PAS domain S-box protein [Nitrospirales bacterium]|nr:PAS domain S-box protein [Nitrospirales bacterium]
MGLPAEEFSSSFHDLQQALSESEERFRLLAEAAFEGIAMTQRARVLTVNSHFCELFGYTTEEACGMSAPDFHPSEEAERVRQMNLSGQELPYRAVCLRKDGSRFIAEIRGRSVPYRGERVRVTAIRDITAFVEAEDRLRKTQDELEARVLDRTRQLHALNAALMEKIAELEEFEQTVVGRELKMIELEHEIARLKEALEASHRRV